MPADLERWERQFVGAMRGDERQRIGVTLCRADGKHFHAQLDCLRVSTGNGSPVLRIALTDVSDLVQQRADLDQAKAAAQHAQKAAEQANGAKSVFSQLPPRPAPPLSALSIYVNLFNAKCAPADRELAAN